MTDNEFLSERATEQVFAARLRGKLDQDLRALDGSVTERLFAARQQALARHAEVVGSGRSVSRVGGMALGLVAQHGRTLLLSLGLLAVVAGNDYSSTLDRIAELEEVESALLSDDLPIDAYLDKGFDAWLRLPDSAQR